MINIMEKLHQYVPIITEDTNDAPRSAAHKVLFGGDQLTAARPRAPPLKLRVHHWEVARPGASCRGPAYVSYSTIGT